MTYYDKLNLAYKRQANSDCCTLLIMGFFAPLGLLALACWLASTKC